MLCRVGRVADNLRPIVMSRAEADKIYQRDVTGSLVGVLIRKTQTMMGRVLKTIPNMYPTETVKTIRMSQHMASKTLVSVKTDDPIVPVEEGRLDILYPQEGARTNADEYLDQYEIGWVSNDSY